MQSDNYPVQQYDTNNLNWYSLYQDLLEYKKQYGHCNVPSTYENQTLFQWVNQQRDNYTKLNMSDERINMLSAIGFEWTTTQEDSTKLKTRPNNYERIEALKPNNWTTTEDKFWNDKFEQLKIYKSKHGHCNVPWKYNKNQPLADWVQTQRSQYEYSKLSEKHINMLNSIGFNWWGVFRDQNWIDKYEELKIYKSKHGHCNVPQRYDENQPLATWVQTQRAYFRHSKLSQERIKMLNSIGFNWAVSKDSMWNNKFKQLKLYKSKNGDCNVPAKYDENQPLATWVIKQRFQFKHSKLSEERINMLNSICFSWTVPKRMDRSRQHQDSKEKDELAFGDEINTAQEDSNIERNFDSREKETTTKEEENENNTEQEGTELKGVEENHEQIAIETSYQDSKEKETTTEEKGEISSYKRSLQDRTTTGEEGEKSFKRSLQDRIEVLCTYDKVWNDKFEELKLYKSKHGDFNVSHNNNVPLANWVQLQRSRFKHSKMTEERINMLNAIGFNWKVASTYITWNDRFEQLKQYKSKHGDCNVPVRYDENQPLASWVQTQRSRFKHSKLSEERINMLNAIGFNWTAPKRMNKTRQIMNHEPIAIETSYQDPKVKKELKEYHEPIVIEANYQDSKEKEELAFGNEINTEKEDSNIEGNCDSKEKETTTKEKGEMSSYKRSLQERIEVLCKISLMFQEQKDAIHADMKRRKLGNSA